MVAGTAARVRHNKQTVREREEQIFHERIIGLQIRGLVVWNFFSLPSCLFSLSPVSWSCSWWCYMFRRSHIPWHKSTRSILSYSDNANTNTMHTQSGCMASPSTLFLFGSERRDGDKIHTPGECREKTHTHCILKCLLTCVRVLHWYCLFKADEDRTRHWDNVSMQLQ